MSNVSESTIRRLSLYLRFLEEFEEQGTATVNSEVLAKLGGTTSAQVRKDLSFFGSFGKRGLGYSVSELAATLRDILGLDQNYGVVVVGAGKMGSAMMLYGGFSQRGFVVRAAYDIDPDAVGQHLNGVEVRHAERLSADLAEHSMDIGVIATPPEAAQGVADRLSAGGIKAILNFAPVRLAVPETVAVKNVNLALELEALSYAIRNR
jgi:redox-sensing transcriptional repressor